MKANNMPKSPILMTRVASFFALSLICTWSVFSSDQKDPILSAVEEQVMAFGGEAHVEANLLEIKFRNGQPIRLRNGLPSDMAGIALSNPETQYLLKKVLSGAIWQRSQDVSEEKVDQLRAEAQQISGTELPDLNLYFRLRLPNDLDIKQIAVVLLKLPEVEAVYRVPLPAPLPAFPDFYSGVTAPYQAYQKPAWDGIDGYIAEVVSGARGTGVSICDVEYNFNRYHADLGTVIWLGGTSSVTDVESIQHGTAVLGIYGSVADGKGTTGIAYKAKKFFAPVNTSSSANIGAAITTCAAHILKGDVVVVEQQIDGPNSMAYVPAEWYRPTFDAIRVAAFTRVVVEAAGNGSENLDSPIYSMGNGGHYPFRASAPYHLENDSGAILVGAGRSPIWGIQARSATYESNYGFRVDLQGWGDNVVTTGNGNLYSASGPNWYYEYDFSGTSSATAIVAGAVASLQGRGIVMCGHPFTPTKVKSILVKSGTPQTDVKHIGPLPNLKKAFAGFACI